MDAEDLAAQIAMNEGTYIEFFAGDQIRIVIPSLACIQSGVYWQEDTFIIINITTIEQQNDGSVASCDVRIQVEINGSELIMYNSTPMGEAQYIYILEGSSSIN